MAREALLNMPAATPVFVSTLKLLLEQRLGASAPIADVLKQLHGWVRAGDLRRDEFEWSGLQDWLETLLDHLPDGRLTRGEVLAFTDANEPVVDEIRHGLDGSVRSAGAYLRNENALIEVALHQRLEASGIDDADTREAIIASAIAEASKADTPTSSPAEALDESAWSQCLRYAQNARQAAAYNKPVADPWGKFGNYTLAGGQHYQEVLLTLRAAGPVSDLAAELATLQEEVKALKDWLSIPGNDRDDTGQKSLLDDKVRQLAAAEVRAKRPPVSSYVNPEHWSVPNVIAHVRFKERVISPSALAQLSLFDVPAFAVARAPIGGDAAAETVGLLDALQRSAREQKVFVGDDALTDLAGYPAGAVVLAFTSAENAETYAAKHGGTASPVQLPLHARVMATVQDADTGAFSYVVFRGEFPEKRVLFLEEIQSDWGQAGRTYGFQGQPGAGAAAPPAAPFVTTTDGWVTLALKRVIRLAAEQGFDYVSWTSGEQQFDRFPAKENLVSLRYKRLPDDRFEVVMSTRHGDDTAASDNERTVTLTVDQLHKRLGTYLASEMTSNAARLGVEPIGSGKIGSLMTRGARLLSGTQLTRLAGQKPVRIDSDGYIHMDCGSGVKVGNFGLEHFYDVVIPKIAKKLIKKLGGAELARVDMTSAGKDLGQQVGFEITEPMRERVLRGVPRYHRVELEKQPASEAEAFAAWFGDSKVVDQDGKPLPVYHGTTSAKDFARFRTPAYFTSMPDAAQVFGEDAALQDVEYEGGRETVVGSRVLPVYLSIENPLELTRFDDFAEWTGRDRTKAERQGYDGVKIVMPDSGEQLWMAFRPGQIKSAIGNNGDFDPKNPDIRYSRVSQGRGAPPAPPFYSALSRAVEALPQAFATADQWRGTLANLSKRGIKQEEILWSGVNDWLELQGDAKLSKDQVLQFLAANGVQVREVMKGVTGLHLEGELTVAENRNRVTGEADGWAVFGDDDDPIGGTFDTEEAANEALEAMRVDNPTKFSRYTLPGGENYRELLLTLPYETTEPMQPTLVAVAGRDPLLIGVSAASQERVPVGVFRSSHWEELNVLAHVRFNDRIDADGNKVLFIEEIQSDWGKKGKKAGFEPKLRAGWRFQTLENGAIAVYGPNLRTPYGITQYGSTTPEEDAKKIANTYGGLTSDVAPKAPFVTNTKAWVSLAVKRMIAYAVENGYAKVAFINGEQSADRYDLAKQVDQIRYIKRDSGLYDVWVSDKFGAAIANGLDKQDLNAEQIEAFVGKDVASKIVGGGGRQEDGDMVLEGLDLRIGGEGMKAFYDQIVPQVVSDILKKVVGGELEQVPVVFHRDSIRGNEQYTYSLWGIIESGEEWVVDQNDNKVAGPFTGPNAYEESRAWLYANDPVLRSEVKQLGFTITDAMREKVLGGLPLFSRGGHAPEFVGMSVDRLREEIDNAFGYELTEKLVDSGAFQLLQWERELPAYLQHPKGGVAGIYDDRAETTYLVAQWIRPESVRGMILHEIGVHYGLASMLGDRAQVLFDQARALADAGDPIALAAARKIPSDTRPEIYSEEILAYMMGDMAGQQLSVVQRAWSKVKGFLFELGADIELAPADMLVMVEGCVKRCASAGGKPKPTLFKRFGDVLKKAFSVADNPLPAGARYAFAGERAGTADQSRLAQAWQLVSPLTDDERATMRDIEERQHALRPQDEAEYSRLMDRLDFQFDPDLVRQHTGWFQGYDGRWRFEIPDEDARLLINCDQYLAHCKTLLGDAAEYREGESSDRFPRLRLDQVLHHPKLFAAYPQLRSVRVLYDPALSVIGGTRGYLRRRVPGVDDIGLSRWVDDRQALSTLLHEIQHKIQFIEGFAIGASSDDLSEQSNAMDMFEAAQSELQRVRALRPDLAAAWDAVEAFRGEMADKYQVSFFDDQLRFDEHAERTLNERMLPEERAERSRRVAVYGELLDDSLEGKAFVAALNQRYFALIDQHGRGGVHHVSARDQYLRLAGEIEARAVQARLGIDGAQRARSAPYSSEGIPAEDVILLFEAGTTLLDAQLQSLRSLERRAAWALQHNPTAYERCVAGLAEAFGRNTSHLPLSRQCAEGAIRLPRGSEWAGWTVSWFDRHGAEVRADTRPTYREALEVFWESAVPVSDLRFDAGGRLVPEQGAARQVAKTAGACVEPN